VSDVLIEVLHDPVGRWFLYIGVVVGAVGAVGYGIITVRRKLQSIASDLGLVKHEVKNDHKTNLREEADTRHDENRATLVRIERKIGRILDTLAVHDFRIDQLDAEVENTRDRRPDAHSHDKG
jgi:hypothetical protein